MRCGYCGHEFEATEAKQGCGGCGGGCHSVHCPRCGYKNPREARLVTTIKNMFVKTDKERGA